MSAYGPGSRFGIIHDEFGIAPADDTIEVSTHGQSVSFEFVAEKNPDYLFVIDRDAVVSQAGQEAEPASKLVENDLVKKTNAYKNGKIIYLDASYWYLSGGGLISVPAMAKEIQEGIK
ncbi:putative ABC transporter solute-binding protein YclQ precursor [compost metagenome]